MFLSFDSAVGGKVRALPFETLGEDDHLKFQRLQSKKLYRLNTYTYYFLTVKQTSFFRVC